jgi:hypothetical protein
MDEDCLNPRPCFTQLKLFHQTKINEAESVSDKAVHLIPFALGRPHHGMEHP